MWYTIKVGPDVANAARELAVHMSRPGPEHWKVLGRLIGYLKVKYTKGIIIRKPQVLKEVMFSGFNYSTDKDTRNSGSGLVDTHAGTILTYSSKTRSTVTLSSTEAEYLAFSPCEQ